MIRRFASLFACLGLSLTPMLALAALADPAASFVLIGHVERFTLDSPSERNSSAVVTVRGVDVFLPVNLVITMPGGYLTAQQLFKGRNLVGPVSDPRRSGLALVDQLASDQACPPGAEYAGRLCPLPPAEVELIGNIVNGRYIAGIARMSQGGLHIGGGFIRRIEADGTLVVGADAANPLVPKPKPKPESLERETRLKLNDPEGIYGLPAQGQDRRFALDTGNSPVHARTGFPVCIQRNKQNDAKCPDVNRHSDANVRRYTCGRVPADSTAPALANCQPQFPAPLREGDFINYVGRLDKDDDKSYFVSLHGLEAELGIYTSPGVDPAHVFVEVSIEGTMGERYANFPQEETTRFKLVGFTTDPSRTVDVFLTDSDTDEESLPRTQRPLRLATRIVPTNGAQLGRFKMIWSAKEDVRTVRRAVRVKLSDGSADQPEHKPEHKPGSHQTLGTRGAGITFGQYVAPISEYIAPEATRFGVKGYQPPVNFENFCFLKRLNRLESLEPDLTNPDGWVVIDALPLPAPPLGPIVRAQSQRKQDNTRVCDD